MFPSETPTPIFKHITGSGMQQLPPDLSRKAGLHVTRACFPFCRELVQGLLSLQALESAWGLIRKTWF